MTKFIAAVKRYSGYTRFVSPYWAAYAGWLSAHPRVTAWLVLILIILAIR